MLCIVYSPTSNKSTIFAKNQPSINQLTYISLIMFCANNLVDDFTRVLAPFSHSSFL